MQNDVVADADLPPSIRVVVLIGLAAGLTLLPQIAHPAGAASTRAPGVPLACVNAHLVTVC